MAGDRPRRIVVGIGNPERGDDAAGRAVAQLLRSMLAVNIEADVEIAEHDGEATALLSLLDGASEAFLVDACRSGAPSGTVRRFNAAAVPLPASLSGLSTHGFGLAEAIELGRTLGQLPPRCVVYAIEGGSFEPGTPLSPAVAAAVAQVAGSLRAAAISGAPNSTRMSSCFASDPRSTTTRSP